MVGQKDETNSASKAEVGGPSVGGGTAEAAVTGDGGGKCEIIGKGVLTNPATAAPGSSLEDELNQLEDLERELGTMGASGGAGGVGGSGGSKIAAADAGKDDGFDMENLDELEGYLESLAK